MKVQRKLDLQVVVVRCFLNVSSDGEDAHYLFISSLASNSGSDTLVMLSED